MPLRESARQLFPIECFFRVTYSRQEQWSDRFGLYSPARVLCLLLYRCTIITYHPLDLSPSGNHLVHSPCADLVYCILQPLCLGTLSEHLLFDDAMALAHIGRYVQLVLALDQYRQVSDQRGDGKE